MKLSSVAVATMLAAGALSTAFALPARANGFLEDSPWQFQSPAALTAMVQMETLRQEKKGGLLNGPPNSSNVDITSTSNTPIGNYSSVTAGSGTTVTLTTSPSNTGSQSAGGELNGALH